MTELAGGESVNWNYKPEVDLGNIQVTRSIDQGLKGFWEKWSSETSQVKFNLPDFSQDNWRRQYRPKGLESSEGDEVGGTEEKVPYYSFEGLDKDKQIETLTGLIREAETGGYELMLDLDTYTSLTPVTLAAKKTKRIVIGIDPTGGPFESYPNVGQGFKVPSNEHAYLAWWLAKRNLNESAAFFFSLDIEESGVQEALKEKFYRTHIIAPDTDGRDWQVDLIKKSLLGARTVNYGGDLIVVGDDMRIKPGIMELWFNPDSWLPGKGPDKLVKELNQMFSHKEIRGMTGDNLVNIYGIADSAWFLDVKLAVIKETGGNWYDSYNLQIEVARFSDRWDQI